MFSTTLRRSLGLATIAAFSAVLSIAGAPAAHAQTVTTGFKFGGFSNYIKANVSVGATSLTNVAAGAITADLNPNVTGLSDPFDAYCIDLLATLPTPSTYNYTLKNMSAFNSPKGSAIAWLYNTNATSVTTDKVKSAGLQLAIWEVLYDWNGAANLSSINVAAGTFKVTSVTNTLSGGKNAMAWATDFLTGWGGTETDDGTWLDLTNASKQDLVGPKSTLNVVPKIPEPSSLALILLPGIALLRRRAKR
jgi:hypothetical protein